jgi:hypothetical protein
VDGPVRNRRIVIEPRLGDLRRVEGTVVTEFGPVPVLWEKADDGTKLLFEVQIPADVVAEMHLPRIGESPLVVIDGQTSDLPGVSGGSKARTSGRLMRLESGPGKHVGTVQVVNR